MEGRIGPSRPSAAIIVAVLAVVAALAGTAVAGPDTSTSAVSKKKVKKIARKQAIKQINALAPGIADEQINKRAPGLSVAHADSAESAASAANAVTATNAANAANAANADQADNANTANGVTVQSIRYHVAPGDNPVELISMGGLTLTANCPSANLSLEAETAANGATLNSISFSTTTGDPANVQPQTSFDVSENPIELASESFDNQLMTTQYSRPLSLGTPLSAVTVQTQLDVGPAIGCLITGHAFSQGG